MEKKLSSKVKTGREKKQRHHDRLKCCDCGEKTGYWKVRFAKFFRGEYGKKDSPYCHECLLVNLEGGHSGGGWWIGALDKVSLIKEMPSSDRTLPEVSKVDLPHAVPGNDKCIKCGEEEGYWKIYFKNAFVKTLGKASGLYCNGCLLHLVMHAALERDDDDYDDFFETYGDVILLNAITLLERKKAGKYNKRQEQYYANQE